MRIATWNVNSLNARLPRVEEWLEYARPDVLCLQETKLADTAFPAMAFQALGYESAHHGEGRWNGVAILSRVGLDDVVAGFTDDREPDSDARLLWATCDGVRVASVYVPNGRSLEDDHYQYKLDWLDRLRGHLDAHCDPSGPLAICGDYNIAPTDDDVWDPKAFVGSTHVSRAGAQGAAGTSRTGASTTRSAGSAPEPGLYTYWDYRAGMFHKHQGMRIDLILATAPARRRGRVRAGRPQRTEGQGPVGPRAACWSTSPMEAAVDERDRRVDPEPAAAGGHRPRGVVAPRRPPPGRRRHPGAHRGPGGHRPRRGDDQRHRRAARADRRCVRQRRAAQRLRRHRREPRWPEPSRTRSSTTAR